MAIANNQIYTTGVFSPIIDKCDGCDRIIEVESQKFCKTYSAPAAKWKIGICNFATHAKPAVLTSTIKVNPLKASKRAMGKK
ncbi:MAG: PxxKW family cysteine-rich protein [Desulfobulbaceae bacterium]|nr:PxxKW family cysteine-rich protein [Desulfobulbaceae bacterium]